MIQLFAALTATLLVCTSCTSIIDNNNGGNGVVGSESHLPKYLIAAIETQSQNGSLVSFDSLLTEGHDTSYLRNVKRNAKGDGYLAEKMEKNDFKKSLSNIDKDKSILFYLPSATPYTDQVFKHADQLNDKSVFTVPCIYPTASQTSNDILSPIKLNLLNPHSLYSTKPRKSVDFFDKESSNRDQFLDGFKDIVQSGLNHPINVLAHGTGARAFGTTNYMHVNYAIIIANITRSYDALSLKRWVHQ
jgi:hypothetical protein